MMNRLLISFAIAITLVSPVSAIEIAELAALPARIDVKEMKPIELAISTEKKGWIKIPKALKQHRATIFRPDDDQLGVLEFTVLETGYMLIACNYDYQGNASGEWKDEVSDQRALKKKGWNVLSNAKLGGALVQSDERAQILFYKRVEKGDTYRLRCNKYDPPYPILLMPAELALYKLIPQ